MKTDLKVVCEISDDLVGYEFVRNEETVEWNDLTRKEQIKALNALLNGRKFFGDFLKEED